jgi:hypothetical protein
VTSIGSSAFYGCRSLTEVTIGDSVTSIGDYAFSHCYKIVEVYNLSSLNITKGSTDNGDVGYYALNIYTPTSGESKLHTEKGYIFYEDGETVYLMGYVGNQTELVLPNKYNGKNYSIYQYAFYDCSSLTSITIPNGVTSIGSYAFYNCSSLTSITIPDSVTSIGGGAFSGCSSLTSITIPNGVTSIGNGVFEDCSKLQYNEYDNAYYLGDESNPYFVLIKAKTKDITSCTINSNTKIIYSYAFSDCSKLTNITIGDSVTIIGENTFSNCCSLTSITIPSSVTSIGVYAFSYCSSLTSITIPDSVTSIGGGAFLYCSSLTSITIPNGVTSIGGDVFEGCTNLQYNEYDNAYYLGNNNNPYLVLVKAKTKDITSCTINSNTKIIYSDAFEDCGYLTSITIPDGVTNIGNYAFYNCRSLKNVYYSGTSTEWQNISISYHYNSPLISATKYYYSESKPTEEGNWWYYDEDGVTPVVWTKEN